MVSDRDMHIAPVEVLKSKCRHIMHIRHHGTKSIGQSALLDEVPGGFT